MQLNFPAYNFNIKRQKNANYIFDIIRKKWLLLTAEEWVRQHVLHYLLYTKKYPASLIAVEREFMFNGLKKRFDVMVFDKASHQPYIIVECKRPDVNIDESVLRQIAVYNARFNAPILWITNGLTHVYFQYQHDESSSIIRLEDLPESI